MQTFKQNKITVILQTIIIQIVIIYVIVIILTIITIIIIFPIKKNNKFLKFNKNLIPIKIMKKKKIGNLNLHYTKI